MLNLFLPSSVTPRSAWSLLPKVGQTLLIFNLKLQGFCGPRRSGAGIRTIV